MISWLVLLCIVHGNVLIDCLSLCSGQRLSIIFTPIRTVKTTSDNPEYQNYNDENVKSSDRTHLLTLCIVIITIAMTIHRRSPNWKESASSNSGAVTSSYCAKTLSEKDCIVQHIDECHCHRHSCVGGTELGLEQLSNDFQLFLVCVGDRISIPSTSLSLQNCRTRRLVVLRYSSTTVPPLNSTRRV